MGWDNGRLPESRPRVAKTYPPGPLPEGRGEEDLRNSIAFGESEEVARAFTPLPEGRGAGGVGLRGVMASARPSPRIAPEAR